MCDECVKAFTLSEGISLSGRKTMAEVTKFQAMNGCSACKHASQSDSSGKPAASYGAGFWCRQVDKAVNSKDGSACSSWEYEG